MKAEISAAICDALDDGRLAAATEILVSKYRFAPRAVTRRRFRPLDDTRVFIRDGFVDRYTGNRLVFHLPPLASSGRKEPARARKAARRRGA